jgi:predicted ferric reductase
VFAEIGASEPDHGFWTNFSVSPAFVGLAFVLVHVALSTRWHAVPTSAARRAPALVWCGVAAAGAMIVLVVTSVWRRLRLSYETWHIIHTVLAAVAVLCALA